MPRLDSNRRCNYKKLRTRILGTTLRLQSALFLQIARRIGKSKDPTARKKGGPSGAGKFAKRNNHSGLPLCLRKTCHPEGDSG